MSADNIKPMARAKPNVPLAVGERVQHPVSQQTGMVKWATPHYAGVRFDGESVTSWTPLPLIRVHEQEREQRDG